MVVGNVMAIFRRKRDLSEAKQALQTSTRASKQTTTTLAKSQVKQGKATLAVAPLGRSLVFIVIGCVAIVWATATLLSS